MYLEESCRILLKRVLFLQMLLSALAQQQTPWQVRRAEALRASAVAASDLEREFDQLEGRLPLDLIHLKTWRDDEWNEPVGEQFAELTKLHGQVERAAFHVGGWVEGQAYAPKPVAANTKIQVTLADSTWDLLNNWAAAEDRVISEIANTAIQAGLRALRADGSIPKAAIDAYEIQSARRIANAQARRHVAEFITDCTTHPHI